MPIQSLSDVTEFPLCWPENKPRAAHRISPPFYGTTLAKSLAEIEREMRSWRARRYIISMSPAYKQQSADPAVAVWFEIGGKSTTPQLRVIACDKYPCREDNAHAVALTLKGLRAFERYGTYTQEQALEGARIALPPPSNQATLDWRAIFGAKEIVSLPKRDQLDLVNARYRRMCAEASNDEAEIRRLNLAIEAAREALAESVAA